LSQKLTEIQAQAHGVAVCLVLVESSGKATLFRTALLGKKGRVEIFEWMKCV
jgi:hypothetical protein